VRASGWLEGDVGGGKIQTGRGRVKNKNCRTIAIDGVAVPQPSLESRQNMLMSIGMGWTF
jgi:hypothetical protein